MRYVAVVLLASVALLSAKERKVTESVVKQDTIVSMKVDTTKTVMYDTLRITKTFNDTSILVKADTVKADDKRKAKRK